MHLKYAYVLVALCLVLVGCGTPVGNDTGQYTGAMFEGLPLLEGSTAAQVNQISPALRSIGDVHRETVRNAKYGYFIRESELIDTIELYEDTMVSLGWRLVDVLEFGEGGFVRRYHRDRERAVLAFHTHSGGGTELLLLQGEAQN
jgi:hypothetical protein